MKFVNIPLKTKKYDIIKFEYVLGKKIPQEYADFLNINNGGKPNRDCFNLQNGEEGSRIRYFFGLTDDPNMNLLGHYLDYKERMHNLVFPICSDSFGNYVCMSLGFKDYGKIYFWDHDQEADIDVGEKPTYANLYLVADSFHSFMKLLFKE